MHWLAVVALSWLALDDGAGQALDRGGHALHPERVRKIAQLMGEKTRGILGLGHAARHEDASGERIQTELDGELPGSAPLHLDVSISARKHPAQRSGSSCPNVRRCEGS